MEKGVFTGNIGCIRWAGKAAGVVLDHVGGFVNTLHGAGFDVELVVAEAVFPTSTFCQLPPFPCPLPHTPFMDIPFLWRKVPVCNSAVAQILPSQHIDASDHMPHHTVSNDNHFLEAAKNFADLLGREPAHIAASRHIWSIVADSATRRHCCEH